MPGEVFGTLADIMLKLKTGGLTPDELKRFAKRENPFATGAFKCDQRNDGWTLLENQPRRIAGLIEGVPFLNDAEEASVKGDVMAERAVTLDANYGQEDAEWLLEHQDMIPVELRKYYLVFPATKWRGPGVFRCVPYLVFIGGRWGLGFGWLDDVFGCRGRLVRPRSK